MSDREAFEEWAKRNGYDVDRFNKQYRFYDTRKAEEVWQAATQAERERCAKIAEGCAMLRSDVEVPRVLMAVADAIRRGE